MNFLGLLTGSPVFAASYAPSGSLLTLGKIHWQHWLLYLANSTTNYSKWFSALCTWCETLVWYVNISQFLPWRPAHTHCANFIQGRKIQSIGYLCYHFPPCLWLEITITQFYIATLVGLLLISPLLQYLLRNRWSPLWHIDKNWSVSFIF